MGLNGWSEALRQELQPDVRVTIVEPGAVATTAQDIADVIAFAVGRPRRMTLNEILIRPTAQAL